MQAINQPFIAAVRHEWITFRGRRRIIALAVAGLVTILLGLLLALGHRSSCSQGNVEVACPTDPVGPQGQAVSDNFYFAHRPLGSNGSITVRMTSMTGIITYPPPKHDAIVPGLVPWAKAGIIIKGGVTPGSSYAALVATGSHGVRMQYDYLNDTAGSPGGVSPQSPRWLRLTRSGETINGYESTDGAHWTQVGTAHLAGLAETVQVGLLATSPGDVTLEPMGGASVRFTQATASFDNITLNGAPDAQWRGDAVGQMGHTDWERFDRAPGLVTSNGTFTVTGSGDIGPIGRETSDNSAVENTLIGLAIGLITVIVIVVAVRFVTGQYRPGPTGGTPLRGRVMAAKAVVIGAVTLVTGLVTAGVALPVGMTVRRASGGSVLPVSTLTELGGIIGVAGLIASRSPSAHCSGAPGRRSSSRSRRSSSPTSSPSSRFCPMTCPTGCCA